MTREQLHHLCEARLHLLAAVREEDVPEVQEALRRLSRVIPADALDAAGRMRPDYQPAGAAGGRSAP